MENNNIIDLGKSIELPEKKTIKDIEFKQENLEKIKSNKNILTELNYGISGIINLYSNNNEFGYIDILNACIDPNGGNNPLKIIFIESLINFGEALVSYKIQSEKYSKTPIFTKAQLEASQGRADIMYQIEKQKVMQEVAAQFQITLSKLFDTIMYFIGVKDSKDNLCEELSKIYLDIDQPTPENIANQLALLTNDLVELINKEGK